ncbi:MAG: iron ABC transporter permease [Actinomycetota bacterium]|nr:iron ABC transporter permease [Actinomycetota bacterium]
MDTNCSSVDDEDSIVKDSRKKRLSAITASSILMLFFGVFYFYPVGKILVYAFRLNILSDVFGSPSTWSVIWFTIWQATLSTFLSVIFGLIIANTLTKLSFRGKTFLRILTTIPFVMPTVVVGSAFLSVNRFLHLEGTILDLEGSSFGIIVAHVFFNTAIAARIVGATWSQIESEQEVAASTLGASPMKIFIHVTLPQLRSSILASSALAFLFTFTSFGVILLLGGLNKATIETEIWRYATQRTDFDTAAALGIAQLVIVVLMLLVNVRLRSKVVLNDGITKKKYYSKPRYNRLRVSTGATFTLLFLGLPLLLLIEKSLQTSSGYSLQHYQAIFTNSDAERFSVFAVREAIWNSIIYAGIAMVIATVIGLLAATLMAHKSSKVSKAADVLLLLPLGTSGVLIGFGVIAALHTSVLDFRSKWWIVPVAQAILGIGFVARIVSTAIRNMDTDLRSAASTLGASPQQILRKVEIPIISRSLVAGAMFAFAIAIGEFGATAFLARPQRPTIPTTIFNLLGRPGESTYGQAMSLSVILVLITAAVVTFLDRTGSVVGNEI